MLHAFSIFLHSSYVKYLLKLPENLLFAFPTWYFCIFYFQLHEGLMGTIPGCFTAELTIPVSTASYLEEAPKYLLYNIYRTPSVYKVFHIQHLICFYLGLKLLQVAFKPCNLIAIAECNSWTDF